MNETILKFLAMRVQEAGGRAFLVGGAVRDQLLGMPVKDFDCEVFGLPSFVLRPLLLGVAANFGLKLSEVGVSFQVFKLGQDIDVSLPRRDRKVGVGHTGFEVEGDPHMTLKEAASRRDFTVNALMRDLSNGEIVDPFGGQMDLKFKVLRAVNENAFEEDPLRVLRGLQFAARFGFELEHNTLRLMAKPDLRELPAERLLVEFEKLLRADRPSLGLRNALKLPNFMRLFPMLADLVGNPEDPVWHGEPDTFTHTMLALDEAAKLVKGFGLERAEALTVMVAVLAHDFGKPDTTECHTDGRCSAHGHAKAGLEPTLAFLDLLGLHTVDGFDVRKAVLALVEHHLFPAQIMTENNKTGDRNLLAKPLRRMAQKVNLDLLSLVSMADLLGRRTTDTVKAQNRKDITLFRGFAIQFDVLEKPVQPLLMGRHLIERGMQPGVQMGLVLKAVFDAQLDGHVQTLEDALVMADDLRERAD